MDDLEREREEIRAALMQASDPALEPGKPLHVKDIIHNGDEDYPAPVVAQTFASAGYVLLYDTKTRVPSVTNKNMLAAQLKKKHLDGTPLYTTVRPKSPPMQGAYKCLLHESDPDRELYASWNFPVCPKADLVSAYERDLHVQHRHKKEWATIERERKETKEREDREFQRAWMTAIGTHAGAAAPSKRGPGRPAKEPELAGVASED